MASVCPQGNGRHYIQVNEIRKRPKIHLKKVSKNVANSICSKVEALVSAKGKRRVRSILSPRPRILCFQGTGFTIQQ
jgi:hypothetical protein